MNDTFAVTIFQRVTNLINVLRRDEKVSSVVDEMEHLRSPLIDRRIDELSAKIDTVARAAQIPKRNRNVSHREKRRTWSRSADDST